MENAMGVKLEEILDRLPDERRRTVEARAVALIAKEMSLRESAAQASRTARS
jgi:hypothetical protein